MEYHRPGTGYPPKPGDHIIVHAPYYQSLGAVASGIGAELSEWKADQNHNWELDLGTLRDSITSRTKVVVVNFPHNPMGYLPDSDFILELSRLSDENGFVVFSDEVYRGLEYDPADRLPSFSDINERAVSLSVMSKTFGLAGLLLLPGTLYGAQYNSVRLGFGRSNLSQALGEFQKFLTESR